MLVVHSLPPLYTRLHVPSASLATTVVAQGYRVCSDAAVLGRPPLDGQTHMDAMKPL